MICANDLLPTFNMFPLILFHAFNTLLPFLLHTFNTLFYTLYCTQSKKQTGTMVIHGPGNAYMVTSECIDRLFIKLWLTIKKPKNLKPILQILVTN